jgi:predicted phosphodiesterase
MAIRFGALGDIHGDFAAARRVMQANPDVPFWLCVGDVADAGGRYEPFPSPLFWIKGNNEDFDAIADAAAREQAAHNGPPYVVGENLFFIPNGIQIDVGQPFIGRQLRIAALGGTFAPTMYDVPAADLPHPKKGSAKATELADRRRHFVREEVEACKRMHDVDVLLTHEAPRPFRVGPIDAGKTPINEILAAMKPRLHLFGHHHRFAETNVKDVRSVCLDLVGRSYLLVDSGTLEYRSIAGS